MGWHDGVPVKQGALRSFAGTTRRATDKSSDLGRRDACSGCTSAAGIAFGCFLFQPPEACGAAETRRKGQALRQGDARVFTRRPRDAPNWDSRPEQGFHRKRRSIRHPYRALFALLCGPHSAGGLANAPREAELERLMAQVRQNCQITSQKRKKKKVRQD